MALMATFSSYSSVTATNPQSSPSLSHSQNKPFLALHSSPSLLQADLIDDFRRRRHLTTRFRGKLLPASRSAVYGLVHIAAGDLLRAEVVAGSENGKRAKEYMEKGMLAPDEIVVMMVKERLLLPDAQENGWLLDGYPRSLSQAKALEDLGIRPDLFILLDVSEDILVERVVGRRLDPVTGKIYHLKYSPPENEEIAARLTQRFDDTEEKVKLRLQTHHQNVDAVLSVYKDIICKVNGNAPKEDVFSEIYSALSSVLDKKSKLNSATMAAGMAS